jgi:Fic family protein
MKEKIYKVYTPNIIEDEASIKLHSTHLWHPEIESAIEKANADYLHWDDLKYKSWIPDKLLPNKEFFWTLLKRDRTFKSQLTPVKNAEGKHFKINTSNYNEFLHIIDKEMAGNFMGISDLSESEKKEYITRNLIEEAIASSQLEGANTSRAVAKKMLLEEKKPHNRGEQMIVNNHKTMLKIEQGFLKENLSWELLCELHRMITDQTLAEEKQGKLRENYDEKGNKLVIKPWGDERIAYVTPDKEFVEAELPRLIDFANDKITGKHEFIHPLIKAILLHFWIGLLHPFEDGNGRLARVLFYWYLLKHEYWAFSYLSLSEKILKSSNQYAMAYIYSEQDDCDLTYFIHYNIEKLKLARKDFQHYLKTKTEENHLILSQSQKHHDLNDRQIKLLHYFKKNTKSRTNIKAYQTLYLVKKSSAISDLKTLVEKGFLIKKKQGRNIYYYPTDRISNLLQK